MRDRNREDPNIAAMEPDGREKLPDSPCPCGRPAVEVEERFDMLGGRNNRHLYYWHNRVDFCHFVRRF